MPSSSRELAQSLASPAPRGRRARAWAGHVVHGGERLAAAGRGSCAAAPPQRSAAPARRRGPSGVAAPPPASARSTSRIPSPRGTTSIRRRARAAARDLVPGRQGGDLHAVRAARTGGHDQLEAEPRGPRERRRIVVVDEVVHGRDAREPPVQRRGGAERVQQVDAVARRDGRQRDQLAASRSGLTAAEPAGRRRGPLRPPGSGSSAPASRPQKQTISRSGRVGQGGHKRRANVSVPPTWRGTR